MVNNFSFFLVYKVFESCLFLFVLVTFSNSTSLTIISKPYSIPLWKNDSLSAASNSPAVFYVILVQIGKSYNLFSKLVPIAKITFDTKFD